MHLEQHGEDDAGNLMLPGLPYTPRQLFWVSYAHSWCGKTRPAAMKNRILTDPHSPNNFRVNGPLSNTAQFAQDFKCPLGSNLNPEKKCRVW